MNILCLGPEAAECRAKLHEEYPEHNWILADEHQQSEDWSKAECLLALAPYVTGEVVGRLSNLAWVHALTTGVDNLMVPGFLPPKVVLTNTAGIHGPQMSELAILFMLALARRFPQTLRNQMRSKWDRQPQRLLLDKTVCIVGVGAIAKHLSPICAALGMSVIGVSDINSKHDGFEKIYSPDKILDAVAVADFVVVLTPYTSETHNLIDQNALSAMREDAFLINIGRGGCLDEDALLNSLRAGEIAGAALDVFTEEPLPQDHPFWTEANMILTPHIGGMSDIYAQQALPIFRSHLEAMRTGTLDELPNLRIQLTPK